MIDILTPFILLLVIMDPVLSLGALMSFARGKTYFELKKIALKSVSVAMLVFLIFAFSGSIVLDVLGVSIDGFRAAGGIILILLGIQLSLGLSFRKEKEDISELAVVIGTPLISGPAVITTTVLFVRDSGLLVTLIAGISALLVVLVCLLLAERIRKLIGMGGMRVLSTMMGIVTLAWGIQFLLQGILGFL